MDYKIRSRAGLSSLEQMTHTPLPSCHKAASPTSSDYRFFPSPNPTSTGGRAEIKRKGQDSGTRSSISIHCDAARARAPAYGAQICTTSLLPTPPPFFGPFFFFDVCPISIQLALPSRALFGSISVASCPLSSSFPSILKLPSTGDWGKKR